MTAAPIPVVCDRCRAEGRSDEDPFAAFGTLLDFDPVPRRSSRVDGWTPDVQRAFVAALSLTGSAKAACRAVGKAQFGVNQLLANPGSDGFRAACEEAMEIASDERSRRLAEGLRAIAEEQAGWRPADPPWAKPATRGRPTSDARARAAAAEPPRFADGPLDEYGYTPEERYKLEGLQAVFDHYMQRIGMERQARLEGRIVEADFYVRQITFLEISIHLLNGGGGRESMRAFQKLRHGGHHVVDIAQTVTSEMLDEARRMKWAQLGEPSRPAPLRPDQMIEAGEIKLLSPECHLQGGADYDERRRALDEACERAAREQVEWEEQALAESRAWRARLEAEAAAEPPESGTPSK
jgi:hypothetical protein